MFLRGLIFAVALLGVLLALTLVNEPRSILTETPMIAEPRRNPYAMAIAGAGIIEAFGDNIIIGVPQEGLVKAQFVNVGQKVAANQPLFQIDDRQERAQVKIQRANLDVAKEGVVKVQSQLDRILACTDPRAVSVEDYKNKLSDLAIAKYQLDLAKKQLLLAQVNVERLIIRAPKAGTVLKMDFRVGDFAQFEPKDPPPVILGTTDLLQVRVDIDEVNAWMFKPNQKAIAFPRGSNLHPMPLEFVRIEPYVIPKVSLTNAPTERIDTRVLEVIYKLVPPKNFNIYVGQQVDVFIHNEQAEPAIPINEDYETPVKEESHETATK